MSLDNRNTSAQFKRAEQLKRWEESEMNKKASGIPKSPSSRRIKFSSGCIFLAACVAGDKDEVEWLLKNGADIDTANVDGLTALHQACIDDNLDMVEFLIQKGADVNRKDNEGWTPLHATASCGFLSIARYLIENGADLAAINSDGELAVDLANSDAMEDMIQHHNEEQGIDCEEARQAEERIMLSDATRWLRTDSNDCDKVHPKTGATAIHVAAAKGYNHVLKLLLEGRGDVDRQDVDGWTPLHAAAYWGQKEATQMLLDHSADVDIQNFSGQLAIDIAQDDIVPLLKDARKNAKRTKRRPPSRCRITDNFENITETPTKVIRVEVKPIDSNKEKEDNADWGCTGSGEEHLDPDQEKQIASDAEEVEEEGQEEDDAKQEEMDGVEKEEKEEEEEEEQGRPIAEVEPLGLDVPEMVIVSRSKQKDSEHVLCVRHTMIKQKEDESESDEEEEQQDDASVSSEPYSSSNPSADSSLTESETDESTLPLPVPIISRPLPVPLTAQIVIPKPRTIDTLVGSSTMPTTLTNATSTTSNTLLTMAPWRRHRAISTPIPGQFFEYEGEPNSTNRSVAQPLSRNSTDDVDSANLRFEVSSTTRNQVSEKENQPTEPDVILRRTQSFENDEKFYQKYAELRARIQANACTHAILPPSTVINNTKTSPGSNNNNNNSPTATTTPASNNTSYLVQRSASLKDYRTLRKTTSNLVLGSTTVVPAPTIASPPTPSVAATPTVPSTASNTSSIASPPTSPTGTLTTTPTSGQIRRSFVPPTRDEESETQRKAHAKRVRETRRSTQGVTLDEIKSAEQLVKKKNNVVGTEFKLEDVSTMTVVQQPTLQSAVSDSPAHEPSFTNKAGAEHGTVTTRLTSASSGLSQRGQQQHNGDSSGNARTRPSSAAGSKTSLSGTVSSGEHYNRVASTTESVGATDTSLLHLRRPPRSAAGTSSTGVNAEENKENDKENDSRTAQATQAVIQRRRRQKRRSTGVVPVGMEDLDPDRQDSPVDGDEKETGSERGRSRVGSTASEADTASGSKPQQNSSRENGGDFIDYKALYEQEKAEKDKLKMSLRKKDEEVVTLKAALDRFTTATTKNNSLSELEKRERRAMERKMSEMEEELKLLQKYKTENDRLRAENRALTRVVSKLTTSAQNQMQSK
ncbi:protein phosphatase 1 regulatory subunit 12A isoform X1 [Anopheles bellator]|uniref:protein phosphatase 1 regulatory subunit 12A isoform X1 n=1 Tax=Anopheles bellator TaxID=139047 RepID=UPI002647150E|nr:protein phosphatase 1 regulatory subunit 12A isoform X1 [Anopheles bellator]